MKLIIAGSRTINMFPYLLNDLMCTVISGGWDVIDELVHGACPSGPDKTCADLIQQYADDSCLIEHKVFPANWQKHGRAAGHIRNAEMADYADALLLIWDGSSPGSKNMLKEMKKRNKPVYEVIIRKHNV